MVDGSQPGGVTGISREEWLRALADIGLPEDDPSAVTVQEFAAMFELDRQTADRRLKALAAAGKATRTHKRALVSDGSRRWCVAYRLAP